jgi:hypothetical protein
VKAPVVVKKETHVIQKAAPVVIKKDIVIKEAPKVVHETKVI